MRGAGIKEMRRVARGALKLCGNRPFQKQEGPGTLKVSHSESVTYNFIKLSNFGIL
jgi:hypothetical protein